MRVMKSVRIALASALVLALPLQAATAAVRPSVAIPSAATAVAAPDEEATSGGLAWPALAVIFAAIVTAVVIESHNGQGRGTGFSR